MKLNSLLCVSECHDEMSLSPSKSRDFLASTPLPSKECVFNLSLKEFTKEECDSILAVIEKDRYLRELEEIRLG